MIIIFSELSKWSSIEAKGVTPCPRGGHTCVVIHSKMLVFGGSASNETKLAFNDLFALDIGNNHVTSSPDSVI